MTQYKEQKLLFLAISALLTGFSETELLATGMLDSYYTTILGNTSGSDINFFFQNVDAILIDQTRTDATTEYVIETQLIPNSSYGGLAKDIIILWYTGNWKNMPVSSAAYIQGLMWEAGYTHPPGAKQPGYGSWAYLPLSIQ